MKRILKFRAWDSDKKVMIFDFHPTANYTIFQTQVNDKFICGGTMQNGDWNEPDLMQYTGLKDKNGKEIYEGDIIKKTDKTKSPMLVEWRGGAWGYSNVMWNKYNEILGNIHENPELLK